MALLKWGDEEEKKEEDLLNPQPATQVASVQSGWQPTQAMDGSDVQGSDNQIENDNYLMSDEKAAVDNQIQQRREAEAAARAEAQRQAAIARENDARAQAAAEMAQAQEADNARKYGGGENENEGGFTGFLKDVGSGIQQGLSALGDIAIQGGSVIGSIGKEGDDLVRHMDNSQKVREWLYGFKDINGDNLRGTSGADEAASRVSAGQGSIEDWAKVGGTGLQAGIDATMFMNPARLAAAGLKPVTAQGASLLARTAANPAVRYAARDAAFFGSLQGTATFQTVYAETGGDLEAATEAALKDMIVGGTLQGSLDLTGSGVGYVANRTVNSLRRPGEAAPTRGIDEIIEEGNLTPIQDTPTLNDNPNIIDEPTLEDGNVSFEQPTQSPGFEPVADNLTPVVDDGIAMPEPMTEWADEFNGQKPADLEDTVAAEVAAVREQPEVIPVVADGVAQAPAVRPVDNMPTVKSEELQLKESRAGTSQAEEAAINQRLQEVEQATPNYFREDSEISDINRILKNEDTVADGRKVADYYREAKGEDWYTTEMSPDDYLDQAARAMGQNPETWRGAHTGNPEAYAEAMRNGDKFPMPFINKAAGTQEGRTRALAAKLAGQEKMRVAIADKYTPERYAARQEFEAQQRETQAEIERSQRMLDMLRGDTKDLRIVDSNYNNALEDLITEADMPDIIATHRARFGDENVQFGDVIDKETTMGNYKYRDDMIALAEGRAKKSTLNHEHVHKAIGQFLEDSEIEQLYKDVVKVRGGKKGLQEKYSHYDNPSWRTAAEEEIANEFNSFLKYGQTLKKSDNIADKLADFATKHELPWKVIETFMKLSARINETFGRNAAASRLDDFYKRIVNEEFANPDLSRRVTPYKEPEALGTRITKGVRDGVGDALMGASKVTPVGRMPMFEGGLKMKYGKYASQTKNAEDSATRLAAIRDGDLRYFDAGTEKVARERFDIPSLKKISGGGSDRDVYDLGDGNVLKITKTARGLLQNQAEIDYYAQRMGLIPETVESGLNYVVSKKMNPPDANTRKFVKELSQFSQEDLMFTDRGQQFLEDNGFDDLRNYDILYNDLTAIRNWGTHPETGAPIHVDGGTLSGQLKDHISRTMAEQRYPMSWDKPKGNLDDPEFRAIYERSRAAKKEFGDTDRATMYSKEAPADEGNLPDGLTPAKAGDEPVVSDKDINKQIANKVMRHTDTNKDAQADLARAVGLTKDAATDVRTLLKDGGVEGRKAERIASLFERAEKISESNKAIQKQYRKDFVKSGVDGIDDAPARVRNRETSEAGDLQRRLNSEIRKLQLKGDMKERLLQGFENVVQGRNANMLTSASVLEKSVTADLWATLGYAAKNPIKMARGMTQHGNVAKNAAKSSARGWKDTPKSVSDSYKYLIGNTYHTAMTPAQIAADFRKGAIRTELSKWIYKNQTGKNISSAQAEKFSRTFGADVEALVNMGAGVENGTISDLAYRRALKDFKKFIETGDEGDYSTYLANIDRQNSLAAAMAKGVGSEKLGRFGASVVNGLLPYMRNAKNMTVKSFTRDLNPFAKSLVDEIRADQVGAAQNLYNLLKNKAVDYGTLALLASTLEYNDGDDVSKPQGVSIHLGGDTYFPVRGTPIELPLAIVAMTKEIVEDTTDGEPKEWQYYAGMIKSSIPYLDYMEQATNVMDSVTNLGGKEGDNGYAAKAYGINMARSLTPFSNNAVMPYVEGKQGNSVDAKKVYDEDPLQWYENSLKNAYNVDRDSLETSRDAAGRVRTMDNQGSIINKGINDELTKTFNDTITSLVKYGRTNGLGRETQDMFNTYDTGKNNNFKSIQDTITFLDVEEGADGKKKPDAAKKLENNEKLADLAAQIRDGFWGEDGDNLLMLGDENLYSDASVPNKDGTKNSRLPMSMQSIKNAIAATDLPEEQRNRMYEISQVNQALYDRRKAGEITYDQEQAMKAENEQEYISILSNSESYKKLGSLMSTLDEQGFFEVGGIGSTKAGQTYLWNSLNALLGSKGTTPAAQWDSGKKFTPWGSGGRGSGRGATNKPGDYKNEGIKWTPVGKRGMANVQSKGYTPLNIKVKLGNAVKKNKTQNYSDRSF